MASETNNVPASGVSIGDPNQISNLNREVSSYSACENRDKICAMITAYIETVEGVISEHLPIETDREVALQPFRNVTAALQAEMTELLNFALVDEKIYNVLKHHNMLEEKRLLQNLQYAQQLHNAYLQLKKATEATSFANAQNIITSSFKTIQEICQTLNTNTASWHLKINEILAINRELQMQNHDLREKITLLQAEIIPVGEQGENGDPGGYGDITFTQLDDNAIANAFQERQLQEPSRETKNYTMKCTTTQISGEYFQPAGSRTTIVSNDPANLLSKAQILPKILPFTGQNGRHIDDFMVEFNGKYSPVVFTEAERRNLFVGLLRDTAHRTFRSLDSREQRGSVELIAGCLRKLLARDDQVNGHAAQLELDNLILLPDQLVEFCDKLESLTKQIFPSMSGAELSYWRASQLYKRITHWNNAVEALNILETTPRANVYDAMRKFVFQVDRTRQYRKAFQLAFKNGGTHKKSNNSGGNISAQQGNSGKNETQQGNNLKAQQVVKCYECGREGHYKRDCPRLSGNQNQGGSSNSGVRSNSDNKHSNIQQNQLYNNNLGQSNNRYNNLRGSQQNRPPTVQNVENGQQSATSTRNNFHPDDRKLFSLSGVDTAAEVNSLVFNDMTYFGSKSLFEVKIGDLRGTALVDSGAQPSILSFSTYRYIIKSIPQPHRFLKLLDPLPGAPIEITNASGVVMPVKAQVLIKLKLVASQKEAQVVFHITNDPEDAPVKDLLLGTNAFAALGIKLTFETPQASIVENSSKGEVNSQVVQTDQHLVQVERRIELWPSEALWIPLKMDNFESFKEREALITAEKDGFGRDVFSQAICKFDDNGKSRILFSNNSSQRMVLRKGQVIGKAVETQGVYSISPVQLPQVMECVAQEKEQQFEPSPSTERGEHLIELVKEQSGTEVPEEIADILKDFSEYFAVDDSELRQTQLVVHDIETGDTKPIRQKLRPVPVGVRPQFREILKSLLERKVIEPSCSPWASPIVLVVKKDGSLRLCIDYRELNKVIQLDAYPLPSIEGILQSLSGKKFFSTLDLASGFWQISLADSAKPKTAFLTTEGLFQFRVLPFGLSTSPASFQRLMHKVLEPLMTEQREVHVYVDDLLVATETKERHFEVLRKVMEALAHANLAVKLTKCLFLRHSVPYLGHLIDGDGIHTDPQKVETIRNALPPKNVKELRSFLGLASYYRKFVLKFASIASPLFGLTKQSEKFEWSENCQRAFDKLKDVLCSAPVLSQPDIAGAIDGSNPFIIYTDAANTGVGAVLSQRGQDQMLHPLWFASKSLTKAESKYHVTDLEALGVVFALKKFQSLIYNMPGTVVRTDHLPLLCLFKKAISARMIRWSLLIQHFHVKIEYVKGHANVVADALSRGLVPPDPDGNEHNVCEDLASKVVGAVQVDNEWLKELEKDAIYSPLIDWLKKLQPPEGKSLDSLEKSNNPRDCPMINLYDGHRKLLPHEFVIEDGYLWMILDTERPRRVVPCSRRRQIFDESHEGIFAGHFNPKKILKLLKHNFYWESMSKDVHVWHKSCVKCFISNVQDTLVPPLKPIVSTKPFEIVGVDLMELGLSVNGNKYVLILIDHFSKWVGGYPIPDKSAETVAKTIATRWLAEGRWPQSFLSDQGPEFLNSTLDSLRDITKIEWKVTKGYLPRENGVTERFNRTLQRSLRKLLTQPADWDAVLPFVIHAYNCSAHESTGDSPYFLLHGIDPTTPFLETPPVRPRHLLVDYSEYKESLVDAITEAHEIARARNAREMERCKLYYDRRYKTDEKRYPRPGDRVFLRLPPSKVNSRHPKLVYNIKGPYRVIEVSDNSALITLIDSKDEPLRVQFDALIIVPPGLETSEINPNRKRKAVPRTLPRSTKTIVTNCNMVICRNQMVKVSSTTAAHPAFVCTGTEINGKTALCPISQVTVQDLTTFFKYDLPEEIGNRGIQNVSQAARCLAILEDNSIHFNEKASVITSTMARPIPDATWARAFHFGRKHCRHIDVFLQVHANSVLEITPSLNYLTNDVLNAACKMSEKPPKHNFAGMDLIVFPDMKLYSNCTSIQMTFAVAANYTRSLRAVAGLMNVQEYRTIVVVLPPKLEEYDLGEALWYLHKCAEINKCLVVITPGVVARSIKEWAEQTNEIMEAVLAYGERCRLGTEPRHLFMNHNPRGPLEFGASWTALGIQLNKLTDGGSLSIKQLTEFIYLLKEELRQHSIRNGLDVLRESKKTPVAVLPVDRAHRRDHSSMPNSRYDPYPRRGSAPRGRGMSRQMHHQHQYQQKNHFYNRRY